MGTMTQSCTTKMLGDAGEHYAVSQFMFHGKPASKMADGWPGYDVAVETGAGRVRVSVKTRTESKGWKAGSWFSFDDRHECEWLALVFQPKTGPVRAWVIPFDFAKQFSEVPGSRSKDPHTRYVGWADLTKRKLARFENNWTLIDDPQPSTSPLA